MYAGVMHTPPGHTTALEPLAPWDTSSAFPEYVSQAIDSTDSIEGSTVFLRNGLDLHLGAARAISRRLRPRFLGP